MQACHSSWLGQASLDWLFQELAAATRGRAALSGGRGLALELWGDDPQVVELHVHGVGQAARHAYGYQPFGHAVKPKCTTIRQKS